MSPPNKKEENNLTSLLKAQQEEFEKILNNDLNDTLTALPSEEKIGWFRFSQTQIITALKEEIVKRIENPMRDEMGRTMQYEELSSLLSYLEDIK